MCAILENNNKKREQNLMKRQLYVSRLIHLNMRVNPMNFSFVCVYETELTLKIVMTDADATIATFYTLTK